MREPLPENLQKLVAEQEKTEKTRDALGDRDVPVTAAKSYFGNLGAAGVMFTIDTESGFNQVVFITSSYGLGETYNVGGWNEKPNIEIVNTVCALLDELRPRADGASYSTQISYVKDRPGHDRRYAIDARKLEKDLGWKPAETFETGIRKTVAWYLENTEWVAHVQSGAYRDWVSKQYTA